MYILKVPNRFKVNNRTTRLMLYTLFALVVADGLITKFLITNGLALEANPFLLPWVGQELFIAIKVSGAFLATLLLWVKYNTYPNLVNIIASVFLTIYTGIVFWNLSVFITS
ncbi:DUF5658 family protein [Chloroflexota bacterium]